MIPLFFFILSSFAEPFVHGYTEVRALFFSSGLQRWQTVERLRPSLAWALHPQITWNMTGDISLWQGRDQEQEWLVTMRNPIEASIPPDINGTTQTLESLNQNCEWNLSFHTPPIQTLGFVDRMFFDIHLGPVDIRIGRQALTWGTAMFINPTDIVPQILVQNPWQERTGLDAIRAQYSQTRENGHEWQLQLVGTTDTIAASIGYYTPSLDLAWVGFQREDHRMMGINVRGDHVVGWWGEFAHHTKQQSHVEVNLGIDYTIPFLDGIWTSTQLFHDSSGAIPELYAWRSRDFGFSLADCPPFNIEGYQPQEPTRQTLGQWYNISGYRLYFLENWNISSFLFTNLADHTGVHTHMLQWRGEWLEGNIGIQSRFGSEGEFSPPSLHTTLWGYDFRDIIPQWRVLSWLRIQY